MKIPTFLYNSLTLSNIRFPLFWQMLLSMIFVLCLAIGVLWGYLQLNFNALMQKQVDTFAHTITQQAASSAAELLMADDYFALSSMLENLVRSSDNITAISIQDDTNTTVALATNSPINGNGNTASEVHSINYQADIIFHEVKAGSIQLSLDNSAISDSLTKALRALGMILIGIVFLAIVSSIIIAKKLTRS
jgi:uncharacterized membrane protein affecting hemolysin expression